MVFSCVNCRARYRIDPKLVVARTVKFVCRKCGQAHLLRDPEQFSECVVATGTPTGTDGTTPTKRAGSPDNGGTATGGWLVMIGGRRAGPMTVEEIRLRHAAGEIDGRTLAWRPTLPQWQRIQDLNLGIVEPGTGPVRDPESRPPPSRPASDTPALADGLFGDLSVPAIDLRRAAEVQPEEPLWHSRVQRRPAPASDLPPDLPEPAGPGASAAGPATVLATSWPAPMRRGETEPASNASDVPEPTGRPTATFRPPDVHDFGAMLQGIQRRERRRRVARVAAILVAALVLLGGVATGAALWLGRVDRAATAPTTVEQPIATPSPRPAMAERPVVTPPSPPMAMAGAPAPAPDPTPTPDAAPPAPATGRMAAPPPAPGAFEAEMEAFLKRRHPDFLACREHLPPSGDAHVSLRIDFVVGVLGAVEDIRIESMDRPGVMPLFDCVRGIIAQGRFSPRSVPRPYHSLLVL